jgi:hypothetical protein
MVVVEKMSPSVEEFPAARTYEKNAAKATNSDKTFISSNSRIIIADSNKNARKHTGWINRVMSRE